MDSSAPVYTIGELSRLTGLPVKTIRYYSDIGVLPPADRTPSGYRLYRDDDRARLELVRTLRELGLGLDRIRSVLANDEPLPDMLALHAEALEAQIQVLRRQRAIARAGRHASTPDQLQRVARLVSLTSNERARFTERFLDRVFEGLPVDRDWEAWFRQGSLPDLPADPSPDQLDAWIELAELLTDEDYQHRIREMAEAAWGDESAPAATAGWNDGMRTAQAVADAVNPALQSGLNPGSPGAKPVLDEAVRVLAAASGRPDTPQFRAALRRDLEIGTDARAERYWQLLAVINGWEPAPPQVPAFEWLIAALRQSLGHPPRSH